MDELRRRLAVILAVEEREPTDWPEVERLASELQRELPIDATPEAVHRYLEMRTFAVATTYTAHVRGKTCGGMSTWESMTTACPSRGWDARLYFWSGQASSSGCWYNPANACNWAEAAVRFL